MQALHDFWMYVPPAMQYVVIALVIFAIATAVAVYKLLTKKYSVIVLSSSVACRSSVCDRCACALWSIMSIKRSTFG